MPIRRSPTKEEIAQRARELYEQHGPGAGEEEARKDWEQAQAELEAAEAAAESADVPAGTNDAGADDDPSSPGAPPRGRPPQA